MRIVRQQRAAPAAAARPPAWSSARVAALRAAVHAEPRQVLVELRADGQHRIERGHRLLRDEGDVAAEQARRRAGAIATRSSPSNDSDPRCDRETGRQQLGDGAADHGFAGAGFADKAEDSARAARSNDSARIAGTTRAADAGADGQVAALQRQHGLSAPLSASRTSSVRRSPSPSRLKRGDREEDRQESAAADSTAIDRRIAARRRSSGPTPADWRRRRARRRTGSPRPRPRSPFPG